MESPVFCVIDIGTGGAKCQVFDEEGALLFDETALIDLRQDGTALSFDPAEVWRNVCLLTRKAVKQCSKHGKKIVTVSSTSMREGNVFYDKEGVELLAVPNLDERAFNESGEIGASLGEEIYLTSGHWPSSIFLVSRLKFLKKKEKELYRKVDRVSMINDWILYKFSGKIATEPTNGCETVLFSLKKRQWSDELIAELGYDRSILPEILECGKILGQIDKIAIQKTGLDRSTQIVIGAADTEAAVAGSGLFDPGDIAAVAGTTTPIQAVVENPFLDEERRTWTCCHVLPNRWTVESNAGATGLVYQWWSNMSGLNFPELDQEIEQDKPAPGKVKVNVGTRVMNSKRPHPTTGNINISPWTHRSEVSLGILETNCFSVRANLEQLESVLGKRFLELYFCGGASKSKLWRNLQSNILGRSLISFVKEATTGKGVAMLSAVAFGSCKSLNEASKSFAGQKIKTKPNGRAFEMYEPFYNQWSDANS